MYRRLVNSCLRSYRGFHATRQMSLPYPYLIARIPRPDHIPASVPQIGRDLVAALKFVSRQDSSARSYTDQSTIVGWLRDPQLETVSADYDAHSIQPPDFIENPNFWNHVDEVLAKHAHEDPDLQAQAAAQRSGWMNIVDCRNPPPLGRAGEPEDILGFVEVRDKLIQPGSFQSNSMHRPVTTKGLFQLPQYLQTKLVEELSK